MAWTAGPVTIQWGLGVNRHQLWTTSWLRLPLDLGRGSNVTVTIRQVTSWQVHREGSLQSSKGAEAKYPQGSGSHVVARCCGTPLRPTWVLSYGAETNTCVSGAEEDSNLTFRFPDWNKISQNMKWMLCVLITLRGIKLQVNQDHGDQATLSRGRARIVAAVANLWSSHHVNRT